MLSIKFIAIIIAIVMAAGTTLTMITVVITGIWVSDTAQVAPTATAIPDDSDDDQGNHHDDDDDDDDGNVGTTPVNTSTTTITPTATITPTTPMTPTTGVTVTVPITSSPIIDIITIIIGFNDYFDDDGIEIDLNIDFGLVPGYDSGSNHDDDDDDGGGSGSSGDHNRGHGNDADGHDEDNPGNSRHDDDD